MIIITNNAINNWSKIFPLAETALKSWYKEVAIQNWNNPNEVKNFHAKVSVIGNRTIVFNIKNNDFRLVTDINYQRKMVTLIWFGSHSSYDKIDVLVEKPNANHNSTN